MAKLPLPPLKDEDFEAPTLKRDLPGELRELQPTSYATTKLQRAEIEALLTSERQRSGMRRAVTDEDVARFERREACTLPAPPDAGAKERGDLTEEYAAILTPGATPPPPLPEVAAMLDAEDEG